LFLGAGATILQVAGNPIMRDVSEDGKYSRNLSLAQFVKAIGSLSGPVIPAIAASYFGADWKILFPIYSVALIITIVSVATLDIQEKKYDESTSVSFKSCLALLRNGYVLMMVAAIFLYVGAEVCLSSGIPVYLQAKYGIEIGKIGLLGTGLFFTTLMIGRFLGGIVLNWIAPKKFFITTVLLSIAGVAGLLSGVVSVVLCVIVIGLGFANIFPLVFSIAVDGMPQKTNELSGLMVTAIVGGAFIPPVMGFVADTTSIECGFLVPLAALLYIGWTSLKNLNVSMP
jgi:fucose permease